MRLKKIKQLNKVIQVSENVQSFTVVASRWTSLWEEDGVDTSTGGRQREEWRCTGRSSTDVKDISSCQFEDCNCGRVHRVSRWQWKIPLSGLDNSIWSIFEQRMQWGSDRSLRGGSLSPPIHHILLLLLSMNDFNPRTHSWEACRLSARGPRVKAKTESKIATSEPLKYFEERRNSDMSTRMSPLILAGTVYIESVCGNSFDIVEASRLDLTMDERGSRPNLKRKRWRRVIRYWTPRVRKSKERDTKTS